MSSTTTPLRIEQLAERHDLLATVAEWIYQQWWTTAPGESVVTLAARLQAHLIHDHIPLTLVASTGYQAVGTVTLLAHDVDTEPWPELSPWLAALYVVPGYRHRGIGRALVNAAEARATVLGVRELYLSTKGREVFYTYLGWRTVHRREGLVVMAKST